MKEHHRKESPILNLLGLGGGVGGNLGRGGGLVDLSMYLWGAGGGDRNNAAEPGNGGSGGFMQASGATFAPSDTLYVYVGSPGITPGEEGPVSVPSVFGGAPNEAGGSYSGGGGGASYVTLNGERTNGSGSGTVIAVAGGGGGNAYNGGGGGGYPTGGSGGNYDDAYGGAGGTQSAGGVGNPGDHGGGTGSPGSFLIGGPGGPGSSSKGGGGGGGYYGGGGGGGANSNSAGGGGGGSSYVNPTYVTADAHATGDSDSNISGPSPLVAEHIHPKWHNRGGGEDYAGTTGGGGTTNAGRRYSGPSESGGRGRVVLTNGTWKRTFNYSGRVESIPASYSPAGLDFTLDSSANHDGPYDKGFGWGHGPGKGCCVYSDASNTSVTATFTFTSGSGSGDRTFTSFEVFTHAGNGKTSLTGQFNSDTPFSFPTHTSDPGTPSGNLAPNLPGGDVSTFKITNPGGSGNTHLFVHEIRINGATVDFGRNYI